MNKILDIVTINYNNLLGLKKTYASIHLGENKDWINWIVIDGGSTDGSLEFIQNLTEAPLYWQSEPDNGIYDAMNIGMEHCTGKFIWFLNSGDMVYDEGTLSLLKNKITQIKADLFYSDTMFIDENGKEQGLRSKLLKKPIPNNLQQNSFKQGMNVGHQSIVIRMSKALTYNLTYKHVADIDWVIRVLKQGLKTQLLPFNLSRFEVGGHSSQNKRDALLERFQVLQKHYGLTSTFINHMVLFFKSFFL